MNNLEKLLDLYEIDLDVPTQVNAKMREGLARMYTDEGIKLYIENAIKTANRNLIKAMDNGEQDKGTYFANRIETLLMLINKARENFVNFEKIKSLANQFNEEES